MAEWTFLTNHAVVLSLFGQGGLTQSGKIEKEIA